MVISSPRIGKNAIVGLLLAAILWLGVSNNSVADETESSAEPRNGISVFVGNTQNGSENGASLGLEYERQLSPLIGVGFYVEYAGGDFDSTSMGVPVFFHPHAGWAFKVAPGMNFEDGGPNFGLRLGFGYEFDIAPKWSLVPELNADFVGGETEFVYGVSFTRKF